MTFNVQGIKSALKYGGARPTLFQVSMDLPQDVSIDSSFAPGVSKEAFGRDLRFLCSAASLPASTISSIKVPYQGRDIKVAGNRTFADWNIKVINDEDFVIRRAFEAWMNAINSHELNIRGSGATSAPRSYQTDAVVMQFAKDNETEPRQKVKFVSIWPVSLGAIELDWSSTDQIETFSVEFAYDYWVPDNSNT